MTRPLPRAVGKSRQPPPLLATDPLALRESWTLDLLAWARHGHLAPKVDLHGARAQLPPVVLDLPDAVIALELWQALDPLHSRPRAFSQIAGRYAPLVIGAKAKALRIEWWDLRGDAVLDLKLAEALGKYLQAEVTCHTLADAKATLLGMPPPPERLIERNPLAWQRFVL